MTLKFGSGLSGRLMLAGVVLSFLGCSSPRGAQEAGVSTQLSGTGSEATIGLDLKGVEVNPLDVPWAKAVVLLFVRTDCPISNHYAPEIQRLFNKFRPAGVAFWLVYPDGSTSAAEIQTHDREYGLSLPTLRDPEHRLVLKTGVQVTPEAAVFLPSGRIVYRGRIDDQYVDFGKQRSEATTHDLATALNQVVSGNAVTNTETVAVGCYISRLR